MNDLAREKLRQLKRGDTLPGTKLIRKHCANEECPTHRARAPLPVRLKRCPRCKEELPPAPPKCCRLCEGPLPSRRQSWCGDECVVAYYITVSSSFLRTVVLERDHGVCAQCGMDTQAIENRVDALSYGEKRKAGLAVLRENGFNVPVGESICGPLWDADHIQARDEGGSWELSNVQTLCHPCHKEKTAEQAGRRAKQQRLLGKKWRPTEAMLRLSQGGA